MPGSDELSVHGAVDRKVDVGVGVAPTADPWGVGATRCRRCGPAPPTTPRAPPPLRRSRRQEPTAAAPAAPCSGWRAYVPAHRPVAEIARMSLKARPPCTKERLTRPHTRAVTANGQMLQGFGRRKRLDACRVLRGGQAEQIRVRPKAWAVPGTRRLRRPDPDFEALARAPWGPWQGRRLDP